MKPRLGKTVECEVCKTSFYINPSRFKNATHTCSKACNGIVASKRSSQKVMHNCFICQKEVFYKPSHARNIKYKSCSAECVRHVRSIVYKGRLNPSSLGLTTLEKYFHDRVISIKRRCDSNGTIFNLTRENLVELYEKQQGLCHYTGIKMNVSGKISKRGNAEPLALSVDKVIPELGYVVSNIVLCVNAVNIFKGNQEMGEFFNIIKGLLVNFKEPLAVNIKRLYPDAILPKKSDADAAGTDLYVYRIEDCGDFIKVFTGIAIQPAFGYYFMLAPRSSTYKKGLIMYNNLGIIDMNYRGEIIAIFKKTENYIAPEVGERIVQLVPQKQYWPEFIEVEELDSTVRADGAFGSSGK